MSPNLSWELAWRAALCVCAFVAFSMLALGGFGFAAEQSAPPPEKVNKLIELLSDPAIKTWMTKQVASDQAAQTIAAVEAAKQPMLSGVLASIRQHVELLLSAVPDLPSQFERAAIILSLEFETIGLIGILALIAAFIAGGFGMDQLARYLLRGYLGWMKTLDYRSPHGRLKALGARTIYAVVLITAFIVGSAGVFLIFKWPPLLREIVLGYLSVAIVTRIALICGRLVLLPPHLKMPQAAEARLLLMSDERAAHWYRYIGWSVFWFSFVGVTLELLAILGFNVPALHLLGVPASFIQLLIALSAIWLRPPSTQAAHSGMSWLLTTIFGALWLLHVSGSSFAFWIALAVVAVPAVVVIAQRMVHHLLRPPAEGTEARAVPPITIALIDRGLRVFIIVCAAYWLSRVLNLDLSRMAQSDPITTRVLRGIINAAIIVLAADFGWSLLKALIAHRLQQASPENAAGHGPAPVDQEQARLRTFLPIVQNLLFAVIAVIALLMVLSALGIEVGPLIAGAGIAGVALGFGAQTLVKDVIAGIFYLFDDAFRVGEYVVSGNYRGTVESFSLRSVKLRHHRGYLFTVPFGELGAVQNMSRDWVIDKMSLVVNYDTDIDKARKIIKKIGLDLAADPEFASIVIEPLKMQGVQNFGDYGIELRLKMMTKPGEQFVMKRRAWVLIKAAFEQAGIKLATPKIEVAGGGEAARIAAAQALQSKSAADTPDI